METTTKLPIDIKKKRIACWKSVEVDMLMVDRPVTVIALTHRNRQSM